MSPEGTAFFERLDLQLQRDSAGLAMYDECRGQAEETARLRNDPTYVERWVAFQTEHNILV